MGSVNQLYQISINTFKQLTQGKVLANTLFLSIGLMVFSFVTTKFTFGVPHKVAIDVGLGLLTLSSVIIALSLGVGLISNEIEARTLYVILSRAVKRETFYVGKILGLSLVLLVNVIILGIFTLITFVILGGEIDSLILWSMFYIFLEAELLLVVTVFLSLICNKALNIVSTITLWIVGHSIASVLETRMVKHYPALKSALQTYEYFFPGFYKLNLKDHAIYQQVVENSYLFSGILYTLLYSSAIILISCIMFRKKNLD